MRNMKLFNSGKKDKGVSHLGNHTKINCSLIKSLNIKMSIVKILRVGKFFQIMVERPRKIKEKAGRSKYIKIEIICKVKIHTINKVKRQITI